MFHIYQLSLSQATHDAVNTYGWDAAPAYLKAQNILDEAQVPSRLAGAALAGHYKHNMTIDTSDVDECFEVGNGMGDQDKVAWDRGRHASMSAGDVAIAADFQTAYYCAPLGWVELDRDFIKWFMATVPTHMKMGQLIASA